MSLNYGNIVRVKMQSDSIHYGMQGFVIRNDDHSNREGPIRVWFGKECDSRMGWPRQHNLCDGHQDDGLNPPQKDNDKNMRIYNYNESDLVVEPAWFTDTIAERHWKRMKNCVSSIAKPFETGTICMVKGCEEGAVRRIVFNIWGYVSDADVCEKCALKYHLHMMDDFPFKGKFEYQSLSKKLGFKLEEVTPENTACAVQ